MDRMNHADGDSDSDTVLRPTGHLSFKHLKRTRMKVDNLTDEEKRWRKRILGRERARRYRKRKRGLESSPPESSDACSPLKNPPLKPRGRGRPKGSQSHAKKRQLTLLPSQSKNFEIGESDERKLLAFGFASPSVSPKEAVDLCQVAEAACSWYLRDPASCPSPNSLEVDKPASLIEINVGTRTIDETEITPSSPQISLTVVEDCQQDNPNMIRGDLGENLSNEAKQDLVEDPVPPDNPNEQPQSFEMDSQASDVHRDSCPGTMEDPNNTNLTGELLDGSKMYNRDLANLTKCCDEKGQTEAQLQFRKQRFKQQNVRDFINFFPTDSKGSIDSKSFVVGSCNLQRQVEYVPSGKRSHSLKQGACETSPELQTSTDAVNMNGLGNLSKTDGELVSSESQDVADASPQEKIGENQTGALTVESISTPSAAQASPASLASTQSSGTVPLPYVSESVSPQPPSLVGVNLPQTLRNVPMSGLLQPQQLINVQGSIQGLNTVNTADQANIVTARKTSESKDASSFQGIPGLPNLEGLGGVQGVAGIQSVVGSSAFQGLQGVTDARSLPLAGLQGVSGIQNIASLQGVLGGLPGISCLQGFTGFQGLGCLPGISGPTSPAALVGVQGIQGLPNLQAVQAFQGVPGLQQMTGLQGLVTLGVTGLPGIQALQGVGIAGLQTAQGLQAVTALQGGAYLPGITGLQGLPNQAGLPSGQELPTAVSVANSEGIGNLKADMGQGLKEQREEAITRDLSAGQPCQPSEDDAEDESLISGTSQCQEPGDAQCRSLDAAVPTAEKIQQLQRGRSRRKQASPRCITKQPSLAFASRDGYDTDEEERCRCSLFAEDTSADDSTQSGSTLFPSNTSPDSKELDPVTASAPQKEGKVVRPPAREGVESPRPGAKLSKKVEELMSATLPRHRLNVDCSSSVAVDDESPSLQTWRRFLEREKQCNDRLKEVEEQLARLQAHANRCQVLGPKSFVSTATQTDPAGLLGNRGGQIDQLLDGSANLREGVLTANRPTEGSGVMCGQIQQGVVTSSGDSLLRNLSPEANRSEDEVPDLAPSITGAVPVSPNEEPLGGGQDTEAKIKNSPRTIWLHSGKGKRKASRRSIRSLMLPLGESSSAESESPLNQEETDASKCLKSPPSSSPQRKMAKFVFQIPLDDLEAGDNTSQVDETPDFPSDNRQDFKSETLTGIVGDPVPSLSSAEQNFAELPFQPCSVLPWEAPGLTKIERNRIRAREGMRRHREKLRQAKLTAESLIRRSVLPVTEPLSEASRLALGSGAFHTPNPEPLKMPDNFNKGETMSQNKVDEGAKSTCVSPAQVTGFPALVKTKVIERTSQVPGSKKPFDILAQVAVKVEPSEINNQEAVDLISIPRTEEPKPVIKTEASRDGRNIQIYEPDKSKPESPFSVKVAKAKLTNVEAGSLSHRARIDFNQEPYKSMSLRERNRIRAREGMRRYRERMKLARLTPEKVLFGMPQGLLKSGHGKSHQGSAKCDERVAASSQLVELAKRHTRESNPVFSYSEFIEHGKAENMKRKRAYSLLRPSVGRPKKKSTGKHPPLSQIIEPVRLGDSSGASESSTSALKSGHIAFPPKEIVHGSDSKSTTEDPEAGCLKQILKQKKLENSLHSLAEHPTSPAIVSPELLDDVEQKGTTSVEMTEKPFGQAARKKVIQDKLLCGMEKYAAISSSSAVPKLVEDLAAGSSHLDEEEGQPEVDVDLHH